MRGKRADTAKNYLSIALGLLFAALAYRMFLVPNDIAPGGFTGIGQLANSLTGINVGTATIILNVPLFAFSMRSLGLKFGVKSLICSISLSLLIDYMPISSVTGDLLLASIFGGVLGGAGFGLILRGNATTGGSDMLGALVHSLIPIKVSIVVFAIDSLVVIASAFVFSPMLAMYALISVFVMNFTLDFVLEGVNMARANLIISSKNAEIAKRILTEMDRGVTGLKGCGKYSGEDTEVLLCVINRLEVMQLRKIVYQTDPRAFVIAINAHEVLGEGFKQVPLPRRKK